MSVGLIIAIVIASVFALFVTFIIGYSFGYAARIHEERMLARDERIRTALKHWHGQTSHRGHTLISPDVVEGGIH